jgi:branched-chain amino acid transport system permease protein
MNSANTKIKVFTSKHLVALLTVGLLTLLPLVIRDSYIWGILVMANIYAALAAGFDILLGYAGLAVIGYALFVGVGAYVAAFLNLYLGLPPFVTIFAAGFAGALFGLLLGIPCMRLKGLYLALASLAAATICEKTVIVLSDYTFGREGLSGLDPISYSPLFDYYASLILMLASAGLLLSVVRSKIGLILNSIRDDQDAAEAVGINTNRYKLLAFLIASFLGGFWGSFMGHYMMHVGPEMFGLHVALTIIMIAIVGGLGTVMGPLGGAYLLIILNELLRGIGEVRLLIYTVFTVVIMLLLPKGIVPSILRFISLRLSRLSFVFRKTSKGQVNDARSTGN